METLRDLPSIEALEDAGLLTRHAIQNDTAALQDDEIPNDEASPTIE